MHAQIGRRFLQPGAPNTVLHWEQKGARGDSGRRETGGGEGAPRRDWVWRSLRTWPCWRIWRGNGNKL